MTVCVMALSLPLLIVIIRVADGCNNPGKILEPPGNIVAAKDSLVNFTCVLEGNLLDDDLPGTIWKVFIPSHEPIQMSFNSTRYPNFLVAYYQLTGYSCKYVTKLTIKSAPLDYNGTIVGCMEYTVISRWEKNGSLTVLDDPKVIDNSSSEECVTLNANVSVHCSFNATTKKGVAVVVWSRNDVVITNQDRYEIKSGPAQGKTDKIESTLMINSFTYEDQGTIYCSCYYNDSLITSNETVTSDNKSTTLTLHTDCAAHKDSKLDKWMIIASGIAAGVAILLIVGMYVLKQSVWNKSKKWCAKYRTLSQKDPCTDSESEGESTDECDENSQLLNSFATQRSYDTLSGSKRQSEQDNTQDSGQAKKHGTCTAVIHPNTSESLHPQPGPDVEPVSSSDNSLANELEASKPDENINAEPSVSGPEVSQTSKLAVKTDVSDEPLLIDMITLLLLLQTENIKFPPSENDGWLEDVSELLKKIEPFVQLNNTELNLIYDPKLEPAHRSVCLHIVIKERKKTNEVSLLLYGIYYGNRNRQLQATTYKSNNEIMSLPAQQGSVQPQETHHHHNITYNLQINYNVATDLALHRAEEFPPNTDNLTNSLRQHASDFMSMVNIAILAPVLFENDLLTSHDLEFLQLLTITDGEKIKFIYIKLLRCGEEGYKKFMECLQSTHAMQHDGHKELYQKLLKSQH